MNRVPAVLDPLFREYFSKLTGQSSCPLEGFYLAGSIALDEFNTRWSDIDFVAVLSHPVTTAGLSTLRQVHARLDREYPRWQMSGMYLQREDLGKLETTVPYPVWHDGTLTGGHRGELNRITWWILEHAGVTLLGAPAQTLGISVDWAQLVGEMHLNINTYWRAWGTRPQKLVLLLSDWGIQWAVLGILRQFYSLHEHAITSKLRAGEYSIQHLPAHTHPVIREALRIRRQQAPSLSRTRAGRAVAAVRLLNEVIRLWNAEYSVSVN